MTTVSWIVAMRASAFVAAVSRRSPRSSCRRFCRRDSSRARVVRVERVGLEPRRDDRDLRPDRALPPLEPVERLLEIVDRDLLGDDAAERGELHDRLLHLRRPGRARVSAAFALSPVTTDALTTWPPSGAVRSSAFCAALETPSESATSTVSVALTCWARLVSGAIAVGGQRLGRASCAASRLILRRAASS